VSGKAVSQGSLTVQVVMDMDQPRDCCLTLLCRVSLADGHHATGVTHVSDEALSLIPRVIDFCVYSSD
jgi:hypothetical protein